MNASDLVVVLSEGAADLSASAPGTAAFVAAIAWAVAQRG
jgi:hypothetical protein